MFLIRLQLLLESSAEAREAAMMGTAQTGTTTPPAFQHKTRGTEKGADPTLSERIPAPPNSPAVPCSRYWPYSALQLSSADREIADTDKTWGLRVWKSSCEYKSLIIPRTQDFSQENTAFHFSQTSEMCQVMPHRFILQERRILYALSVIIYTKFTQILQKCFCLT